MSFSKTFRISCVIALVSVFTVSSLFGQGKYLRNLQKPEFLNQKSNWADSMLKVMNLDEKIGQLFMVASWSNKDEPHFKEIDKLIEDEHIGGLIFFQGGPERQYALTNRFQRSSKIPLMLGMDAEWGLAMRLDSTLSYPKQMTGRYFK